MIDREEIKEIVAKSLWSLYSQTGNDFTGDEKLRWMQDAEHVLLATETMDPGDDEYAELNLRLAEIAGLTVYGRSGIEIAVGPEGRDDVQVLGDEITWDDEVDSDVPYWWSPITNWGQMGPLQAEWIDTIERLDGAAPNGGDLFRAWALCVDRMDCVQADDSDLLVTIARAIVAAHDKG